MPPVIWQALRRRFAACTVGPFATNPGGPGEAAPPSAEAGGPAAAARPSSSSRVRALEGIAGSGAAVGIAFARSEKLKGCSGFVRWDAAVDIAPISVNCQLYVVYNQACTTLQLLSPGPDKSLNSGDVIMCRLYHCQRHDRSPSSKQQVCFVLVKAYSPLVKARSSSIRHERALSHSPTHTTQRYDGDNAMSRSYVILRQQTRRPPLPPTHQEVLHGPRLRRRWRRRAPREERTVAEYVGRRNPPQPPPPSAEARLWHWRPAAPVG